MIILTVFLLFGDNDGDGRLFYSFFEKEYSNFSSLIKIIFNSVLVFVLYGFAIYKAKPSKAINLFINNLVKGKFRS